MHYFTNYCSKTFVHKDFLLIFLPIFYVLSSLRAQICCELSNDPDEIQFLLFPDSSNPNNYDEIKFGNNTSLMNSRFQPNIKTILITHGFRTEATDEVCQLVKNSLLAAGLNNNIIIVGWGKLSSPIPPLYALNWYSKVVENVPIVGKRVGEFIAGLTEAGLVDLTEVYLIGHSLGAHVMGQAGKEVLNQTGNKIGRITGLDPALPDFFPPDNTSNLVKHDAKFVDVIHTDMAILGDITRDGHADFYPNGGNDQPGCEEADHDLPNLLGTCSHSFAFHLYAESITKAYYACPCSPFFIEYPKGDCSTECENPVRLGYYCPDTTNGEFYLITDENMFSNDENEMLDSLPDTDQHNQSVLIKNNTQAKANL